MLGTRRRHRSRKVKGDSRTIPLPGTGDDAGVWFTCWYCGFTDSKDRNSLGGPDSRDGIVSVNDNLSGTVILTAPGAEPGIPESAMAVLDGDTEHFTVALKSDPTGAQVLPDVQEPTVYDSRGFGCSLCHSLNWRGDF